MKPADLKQQLQRLTAANRYARLLRETTAKTTQRELEAIIRKG